MPSCKRRATACAWTAATSTSPLHRAFGCYKLIANSGLTRIVFGEFYRDLRIFELSEKLGIKLDHLPIEGVPREAAADRLQVERPAPQGSGTGD
jgi:hypothetical protein